jgi:ABC-2 type transport system permease protein
MREGLQRAWGLVIKEALQLKRDKLLFVFVLLGPLLELMLMGGLAGGGVENLPLALVDLDRSRASRELAVLLDQSEELDIRAYEDSVAQAQTLMQQGEVSVIAVIPPGYDTQLAAPRETARVQIIADDTNYVVSTVSVATAETVAGEIMRDLAARYGGVSLGPIDLRFAARFNGALDDRPHSITMMLGLIVYQVTLIIAAQSFIRERDLGTLEQIRVTPMGRWEMIIGKAFPVLVIGLADCLLMTGVIVAWFDIPLRGSLALLMLLAVPFILVQIGWGTLISLVSKTQQQAMMMVFALAMLEIACSGFMMPASTMPAAMRFISQFSSVNHYMTIVRGIMLRGTGLATLWPAALALSGLGTGVLGLAYLRLRAGLDADSLQVRVRARLQEHIASIATRRKRAPISFPVLKVLAPSLVPSPALIEQQAIVVRRRRRRG